jgi:hypothetical protein
VSGTLVQIVLRTKYFADSLAQVSGRLFEVFRELYDQMKNGKSWVDIDPLIRLHPDILGAKIELGDCFAGLCRLFASSISWTRDIIFHIPHGYSVARFFSTVTFDFRANLNIVFFETRSLVLSDIPETLGDKTEFTLYVVVSRLSKTRSRLWFRDSRGWLCIHGRNIEESASFRRDNISLLGYIRNLTFTNVFRFPLNCDRLIRRSRPSQPMKLDAQLQQPEFSGVASNPIPLPRAVFPISPFRPTKLINIVFWENPESSSWGTEQQTSLDIESDATGTDLLIAVGRFLGLPRALSKGYEIVRIFPDLEHLQVIGPNEGINANDDDVFHVQPMIPASQACPVVLMDSDEHRIDIRRVCIS